MTLKLVVFGGRGWLGQWMLPRMSGTFDIRLSDQRISPSTDVVDFLGGDRALCLIGRTRGGEFNNIDYLEDVGKTKENVESNLAAPLILAMEASRQKVHLTYFGTACLFQADREYGPDDIPNYTGSAYCTVKGVTDQLMNRFDNVLNVRLRMPVTDMESAQCYVKKLVTYGATCGVLSRKNTITIMQSVLFQLELSIIVQQTGPLHLVNKGPISHAEILELYKKIVNPKFTYKLQTEDEHREALRAARSDVRLTDASAVGPPARDYLEYMMTEKMSTKEETSEN